MNAAGYSSLSPLFRVCDGVRIRYADNRADSSAVTVLMLSPWPESLWAFRRIWERVSGVARVVAIDLPGFGHSDGRPELIAPDAMGTFLAHLIEEWGLRAPHAVGPNGGAGGTRTSAPPRHTALGRTLAPRARGAPTRRPSTESTRP
jgi:pimeloyl-ACP methyl ester carboxylesterase